MKHDLLTIQPVAILLWKQLKPFCKKIKIAGSIRRQRPQCKDIEIVLLPTDNSARNKIGLFLIKNGKIVKGKLSGRYVKATYKGFTVDLFIPQEHDYYRQLAIRTGSAEYSKKIASAWKKKGYEGTKRGLVEMSLHSDSTPPVSWTSEQDFFNWLGMEYLPPENRI